MTFYRSADAAFARADQIKKATGAWPGVITHTGVLAGAWSLTFDPWDGASITTGGGDW